MEKISPKDIAALSSSIGKKCLVEFDHAVFSNKKFEGLITSIEFNDRTGKIRIVIEIDEMRMAIPTESIVYIEVESLKA